MGARRDHEIHFHFSDQIKADLQQVPKAESKKLLRENIKI